MVEVLIGIVVAILCMTVLKKPLFFVIGLVSILVKLAVSVIKFVLYVIASAFIIVATIIAIPFNIVMGVKMATNKSRKEVVK